MEPVRSNKLKDLTDAYLETLLSDLPSEEDIARQQVLSKRFLRRMSHLIKNESRTPRTWKKVFLVAAIMGTIMATAVSVYAYREAISSFITYIYKEFTSIVFQQPSETSGPSSETNSTHDLSDRLPRVIPQGYKISDQLLLKDFTQITYTNEAGDILQLTRQDKRGLQMGIDTEGVTIEDVEIKGYKGIFYSNKGQNNLVWEDNDYAYTLTGIITKQELIKLANSTK